MQGNQVRKCVNGSIVNRSAVRKELSLETVVKNMRVYRFRPRHILAVFCVVGIDFDPRILYVLRNVC